MIAGCIYGVIDLKNCFGCVLTESCEIRKNFIPHTHDKGPDAVTSDFIMCRGEFDPYNKIRKIEIQRESKMYRLHIAKVQKELGLE